MENKSLLPALVNSSPDLQPHRDVKLGAMKPDSLNIGRRMSNSVKSPTDLASLSKNLRKFEHAMEKSNRKEKAIQIDAMRLMPASPLTNVPESPLSRAEADPIKSLFSQYKRDPLAFIRLQK